MMGQFRDWLILKKKILYLERFGCHHWLDRLMPVINKFIEAIYIKDKFVDKEFWNLMCQNKGSMIYGWCTAFFPYTAVHPKYWFHNT